MHKTSVQKTRDNVGASALRWRACFLLALGAMNLMVMILIAATIATEKLVSQPELFVRIFGIAALIIGAIAITGSFT